MLPIRDINRTLTTPHVNRLLIIVNIIIFLVFWLSTENIFLGDSFTRDMEENFVMIPNDVVQGKNLYTLFTSMFMHAGLFHLFGNMLYLYIFGDNVEEAFGHVGYLLFYITCGLMADFAHIMSLTSLQEFNRGVVGASGAISGVLGAYLVLYPKAKVLTLIFYGWPIIIPIPAVIFLGFWFFMQWLYGLFDISGGVAYWAHIGGFIAGIILAFIFARKRKQIEET